jgi:mono/diheme cytochrome c family protein
MDKAEGRIGSGGVGVLCCAAILLSACAPDSDRPLTGPQAVERGAQVFDYNCGACHGDDGQGPSLSEIKSLTSDERRARMISHPIAGQIPQRLRAHELSDLREFFEAD